MGNRSVPPRNLGLAFSVLTCQDYFTSADSGESSQLINEGDRGS